jgi:hypothetical protein
MIEKKLKEDPVSRSVDNNSDLSYKTNTKNGLIWYSAK